MSGSVFIRLRRGFIWPNAGEFNRFKDDMTLDGLACDDTGKLAVREINAN